MSQAASVQEWWSRKNLVGRCRRIESMWETCYRFSELLHVLLMSSNSNLTLWTCYSSIGSLSPVFLAGAQYSWQWDVTNATGLPHSLAARGIYQRRALGSNTVSSWCRIGCCLMTSERIRSCGYPCHTMWSQWATEHFWRYDIANKSNPYIEVSYASMLSTSPCIQQGAEFTKLWLNLKDFEVKPLPLHESWLLSRLALSIAEERYVWMHGYIVAEIHLNLKPCAGRLLHIWCHANRANSHCIFGIGYHIIFLWSRTRDACKRALSWYGRLTSALVREVKCIELKAPESLPLK